MSVSAQLCSQYCFLLCSKIFPTSKIIKPHDFNARLENNTTIF